VFKAYLFGTLATAVKTFAWWLNQWPSIHHLPFLAKWFISASVAGLEYLPLTAAFSTASAHGVHLGLLTAFMEAMDNFLRMMQQVGLHDPLGWFDWIAALGLGLFVGYQGWMHFREDKNAGASGTTALTDLEGLDDDEDENNDDDNDDIGFLTAPDRPADSKPKKASASAIAAAPIARPVFMLGLDKERFIVLAVGAVLLGLGSPLAALAGGWTGKSCGLPSPAGRLRS
jgi:hypothetical protein